MIIEITKILFRSKYISASTENTEYVPDSIAVNVNNKTQTSSSQHISVS